MGKEKAEHLMSQMRIDVEEMGLNRKQRRGKRSQTEDGHNQCELEGNVAAGRMKDMASESICFFVVLVAARRFKAGDEVDVIAKDVVIGHGTRVPFSVLPICQAESEGSEGFTKVFPRATITRVKFGLQFNSSMKNHLFCANEFTHEGTRALIAGWRYGMVLHFVIGGIEKRIRIQLDNKQMPRVINHFIFTIYTRGDTIVDWIPNFTVCEFPPGRRFAVHVSVNWTTAVSPNTGKLSVYSVVLWLAGIILVVGLLWTLKRLVWRRPREMRVVSNVYCAKASCILMAGGTCLFFSFVSFVVLQGVVHLVWPASLEAFLLIVVLYGLLYGYCARYNSSVFGANIVFAMALSLFLFFSVGLLYCLTVITLPNIETLSISTLSSFYGFVIFHSMLVFGGALLRECLQQDTFSFLVVDNVKVQHRRHDLHYSLLKAIGCVLIILSDLREITFCVASRMSYNHSSKLVLDLLTSVLFCVCVDGLRLRSQVAAPVYFPDPVREFCWCLLLLSLTEIGIARTVTDLSDKSFLLFVVFYCATSVSGLSSQLLLLILAYRRVDAASELEPFRINV